MVLSQTQKNTLHKDILEYLANNDLPKTALALADETGLALESVDP